MEIFAILIVLALLAVGFIFAAILLTREGKGGQKSKSTDGGFWDFSTWSDSGSSSADDSHHGHHGHSDHGTSHHGGFDGGGHHGGGFDGGFGGGHH